MILLRLSSADTFGALDLFWAPFDGQLGTKGIPKSVFLAPRFTKKLKNDVSGRMKEKMRIVDEISAKMVSKSIQNRAKIIKTSFHEPRFWNSEASRWERETRNWKLDTGSEKIDTGSWRVLTKVQKNEHGGGNYPPQGEGPGPQYHEDRPPLWAITEGPDHSTEDQFPITGGKGNGMKGPDHSMTKTGHHYGPERRARTTVRRRLAAVMGQSGGPGPQYKRRPVSHCGLEGIQSVAQIY